MAARPRTVALAGVCALTALGAAVLGMLAIKTGGDGFASMGGVICRPGATPMVDPAAFGLSFAAWSAMALIMMLPTAAPMLLTYAEIADTAAAKGAFAASPLVLAAGYLAGWIAFAFGASVAEIPLSKLIAARTEEATLLAGAGLVLAGLYQFSALKRACLAHCRRPFSFFFANWTDEIAGVFRLGLRQGIYCLGCCWALMLLMLAFGAMNLVWMAALAVVMAAEKLTSSQALPRAVGVALIAAGAVVFAQISPLLRTLN